jgi:C_GCAxxG_C_C family probable redox protein
MDALSRQIRLLDHIEKRAANLFLTRQLQCAEAVMVVLNQGLRGDLPPELAVRLASALPEGMGRQGCLCGALNGGALALGLFLGRSGPGYGNGAKVRRAVGALHDRFKTAFKSTCCRVLTKSMVYGSDGHFQHCARMTGTAARLTAEILFDRKPELVESADWDYLSRKDRRLAAEARKLIGTFGR